MSEHAEPTTRASAFHDAAMMKAPDQGLGLWIDISRFAFVWSLGRLSGRPMRDASAIADLLGSRGVPLGFRTAGV
jgi:hypothetical protein